jgi:muconolactone delta-isomerase
MKQFMAYIKLPDVMTEEFISLIPKQRAKINSLMRKGIIISYTLSSDRSQLWVVLDAESEINVLEVLAGFPLIRFMKPEIHELMFHNSVFVNIPTVSLN